MAYHKNGRNRALITSVVILVCAKLACREVIWVRHNHWPHELPRTDPRQRLFLILMSRLSTKVVAHRNLDADSTSVPHPLYFEGSVPQVDRDIEFLFFGTIKPYKGLDKLLEIWPSDRRLVIAGQATDSNYLSLLEQLIERRQLEVTVIAKLLSYEELNGLLLRTKYYVQPHFDNEMIVSGAFFHASSLGVNVISRKSDFSVTLCEQFNFVTVYNDGDIEGVLSGLNYIEPQEVTRQIINANGFSRCVLAWEKLLT